MPDDSPTPVTGRQLVRCFRCGRTTEATHADLMRYVQKGWPSCCGQVMTYFTEAKRPGASGDPAGQS
jgi:hypothetical protein